MNQRKYFSIHVAARHPMKILLLYENQKTKKLYQDIFLLWCYLNSCHYVGFRAYATSQEKYHRYMLPSFQLYNRSIRWPQER